MIDDAFPTLADPAADEPVPAPPEAEGAGRVRRAPRSRSWLVVIGSALAAALLLRVFVFEAFRIPSTSMEDTLLVGDFVFVSKLHYGPRLPITFGVPFTDRYLRSVEAPPVRLPGIAPVRRGDVAVFNYPLAPVPIDRRQPYIKRIVGLPGDTLRLVAKRVVVNGDTAHRPLESRSFWRLHLAPDSFEALSRTLGDRGYRGRFDRLGEAERLFEGTRAEAERVGEEASVLGVEPFLRGDADGRAGFPSTRPFTQDDYGPLVVPRAGWTVALTDSTWALYRDVLVRYEGRRAGRVAGGFEIDGALTDRYTFRGDYYFVLGDNRDDSADSRSWGFVPASHLVGKAVLVYFSWDPEARRPRWDRFFRPVRREF